MTAASPTLRILFWICWFFPVYVNKDFLPFWSSRSGDKQAVQDPGSPVLEPGPSPWVAPISLCWGSVLVPSPWGVFRPGMPNRFPCMCQLWINFGGCWERRDEGSEAAGIWVPLEKTRYLTGNTCHGNTYLPCLEWGHRGNRLFFFKELGFSSNWKGVGKDVQNREERLV